MIRPFRSETERYGEYSKAGEFVYDHPFQWGSKRTGPDLHRVGGKYPDAWHYNHMIEPRSMSPGSLMPPYPWLASSTLDTSTTVAKIEAMQWLGVPYQDGYAQIANRDLQRQGEQIAARLKESGIEAESTTELIALIAYLQRLGTDISVKGDGFTLSELNKRGERPVAESAGRRFSCKDKVENHVKRCFAVDCRRRDFSSHFAGAVFCFLYRCHHLDCEDGQKDRIQNGEFTAGKR